MLKHPFKVLVAKDKTRYDIEKRFNQAVKTNYLVLNKINQKYDELTSDAERMFELFEHEYNETLINIETIYKDKRNEHQKNYANTGKSNTDNQKKLQTSYKEKLEALKLDYKKSTILIDNERDDLEQERTVTLKEIEKKLLGNRTIFQDKLERFQSNYHKNQAKTKEAFERIIKAFEKSLSLLNEKKNNPFEKIFENFEKNLEQFQKNTMIQLKTNKHDTTSALLVLRRAFSIDIKALNKASSSLLAEFNIPMEKLRHQAALFIEKNNVILTEFDQLIEADYALENTKLSAQLHGSRELPIEPSDAKDLRARIKLISLRKDTLLNQNNLLRELAGDIVKNTETIFTKEHSFFTETLNSHDKVLQTFDQQIIDLFNTIESCYETTYEYTVSYQKGLETSTIIENLKTRLPVFLSALTDFEINRLNAHLNYANRILSVITQIDEINLYLDTIEPLKEIESSKQKMINEIEDTNLRYDMKKNKLDFELNLIHINEQISINEQSYIHEIILAKETQIKEDGEYNHQFQLQSLDVEEKSALSETLYLLRNKHLKHDLSINDQRYSLEKEKLGIEHQIKILLTQKEFDLNHLDLQRTIEERLIQLDYEIKESQKAIIKTIDRRTQLEYELTKSFTIQKTRLHEERLRLKKELDKNIELQAKDHSEKMAFIDRALEKELIAPNHHYEEINQLIKQRVSLVKVHLDNVTLPLSDTKKALTDVDTSLKPLLIIVSSTFIKSLSTSIDEVTNLLSDSHRFVYDIVKKHLESEEIPLRKKQNLLDKHTQDFQKTLQKISRQKNTFKSSILSRVEAASVLIKQDKDPKYQAIVQVIKPLYEMIAEQIPSEFKNSSKEITDLYLQLCAADKILIERAKNNHEKAQILETQRYEESLTPIKEALQNWEKDSQTEQNTLLNNQRTEKEKALSPFVEQLQKLQNQINQIDANKSVYQTEYQEKYKVLSETLKASLQGIQNEVQDAVKRLEIQHRQKIEKLSARQIDFQNIFEYDKTMASNEHMHLEQTLLEFLRKTQTHYDDQNYKSEQSLSKLKQNKEQMVNDEQSKLNQQTQSFEDRILSSNLRLEANIDLAVREIDYEALIKEQQLKELIVQSHIFEQQFDQFKDTALKALNEEIENLLSTSSDSKKDSKELLNSLEKNHEKLLDDLISFTLSTLL